MAFWTMMPSAAVFVRRRAVALSARATNQVDPSVTK